LSWKTKFVYVKEIVDLFLLMTILTEQLELELGFLDLFPQLELLSSCSKQSYGTEFKESGSGSSISSESGSRVLMTKNWRKKIQLNFLYLFWSNIPIYLFFGLHKGRLSYRRSLQPSKENIQHFKKLNSLTFFYVSGAFLPSWIPLNPDPIRIRIHNIGSKAQIV
jgi:hypothetical protein